jgi:hypothetical protein
MAFVAALGATTSYAYFSDRYVDNVCNSIIEKYKSEAILNGFEDYTISGSR